MARGRGHLRAAATSTSVALIVLGPGLWASGTTSPSVHADDASAHGALMGDDECAAQVLDGEDMQAAQERCAMNALQLRAASTAGAGAVEANFAASSDTLLQEHVMTADGKRALTDEERAIASRIWHYALPCYSQCGAKSGYCDAYCGPGNACCKYLNSADPPECHTARFWPVTYTSTCVSVNYNMRGATTKAPDYSSFDRGTSPSPSTVNGAPAPASLVFTNPLLFRPSEAPVMKFYIYRVQSDENYAPENQNMGNIPGMLWYLHNEIVWHPNLKRSGTYFSTSKTRLEKFRIMVRPTQPLFHLGMNFGVVNAFDSTRCTGPYGCKNFREFGYAVGCETWVAHSGSDFPHGQWDQENKYPNAVWYSLPGPCPTRKLEEKTPECIAAEPGGACVMGGIPTGAGDCTYTYEKVGEITISELEGIEDESQFKEMGGFEYDKWTDKGHLTDFWNDKGSEEACKRRIQKTEELFKKKYPTQEDLPDPMCDFNKWKLETAMTKANAWG